MVPTIELWLIEQKGERRETFVVLDELNFDPMELIGVNTGLYLLFAYSEKGTEYYYSFHAQREIFKEYLRARITLYDLFKTQENIGIVPFVEDRLFLKDKRVIPFEEIETYISRKYKYDVYPRLEIERIIKKLKFLT